MKLNELTLLVDAVNLRGRPVLGVKYEILVGGKPFTEATKERAGFQTICVTKPKGDVEIVASLPGWETQRIRVVQDTHRWTFKFPGAGVPAVLIVCALDKESRAVLDTCDGESRLPSVYKPNGDSNDYWVGEYAPEEAGGQPRRVLVATAGMGITGAAITATHALRSFPDDITQVLMVGIAGACPNHKKAEEHVRLGDVVVANEGGVIQYDFIKKTVDGDIHRANPHRPSAEFMRAASSLEIRRLNGDSPWERVMSTVIKAKRRYARPSDSSDILHVGAKAVVHPKDPDRRARKPRIFRGAIGSANILLKDPALRDLIRDKFGARAIEMEGSGVMDAGWAVNMDIMVVRGICDYCDSYKSNDWQAYAALAAAAYAKSLVLALTSPMP